MIGLASQPSIGLLITVLAILAAVPPLVVLSTTLTTRPGKSRTLAALCEASIRSITAKIFLWGVWVGAPSADRFFIEYGIQLPRLTALTLDFARLIRETAGTPERVGILLFCGAAAVAVDTAIFHQLGKRDLRQSRRFSIIVSMISLSVLDLAALLLALSYIKLLNDLS